MIGNLLKRLRVVIALCFFIGITWFFVAVTGGTAAWLQDLLQWQFGPSLLVALSGGTVLSLAVILLLTLIFGRVYCSFMCPLGIFQDGINHCANWFKSKKQRRFHYHSEHSFWRVLFFAMAVAVLFFGSSWLLSFFDPYGIYGKMATHLGKPIVQFVNNLLAAVFPNTFFHLNFNQFSIWAFVFACFYLLIIGFMSAFRGRLYCNTVCPVGSFLGLISRFSMFRIQVDHSKCIHCLRCGFSCKAQCLDSKNARIDYSRCVACFNCMPSCTEDALVYRFAWRKQRQEAKPVGKEEKGVGPQKAHLLSRRQAIGASVALVAGSAAGIVLGRKSDGLEKDIKRVGAILPPGSINLAHLKEKCVACHACVAACPSKIIAPAVGEYGIDGFLLPTITYKNGFCSFDCKACSDACPTGALQPMTLDEKKKVQIGRARIDLKNCIIVKDGTDCGACDEHCPVKAVRIEPKAGYPKPVPQIHGAECLGCGGCEYICPATPKAIVVVPFPKHITVKITIKEADEKPVEKTVDFGF